MVRFWIRIANPRGTTEGHQIQDSRKDSSSFSTSRLEPWALGLSARHVEKPMEMHMSRREIGVGGFLVLGNVMIGLQGSQIPEKPLSALPKSCEQEYSI